MLAAGGMRAPVVGKDDELQAALRRRRLSAGGVLTKSWRRSGGRTLRILYLAHRVPYPPNKGDKIRSYHHLRHLAAAHEVSLLTFAENGEDERAAAALRRFCRSVDVVYLDRPRAWARAGLAAIRGRPLVSGYLGVAEMWRRVRRLAAERQFDVAWSFSSAMAQYLAASAASRRVADFIDANGEKWREYAARHPPPLAWIHAAEGGLQRRFERRASRTADRILFVSEEEAAAFRRYVPRAARVSVIPNGVDTEFFRSAPGGAEAAGASVLFTGALDYAPNVDAVLFLLRAVMPLVRARMPGARLTAVGHNPSRKLIRASRCVPGFDVAGSVPDVRPFFSAARAYAAPLRFGRGVKNKILEAMAMGVPVVGSRVAVMGLTVRDGVHVRLAESPSEFAAALVDLLRDGTERQTLAANALDLVRRDYRWEATWPLLDACLAGEER